MMSRMPRLTAWLAPARGLDHRLGGIQWIGRRGDRGVGRVPVEPFLEVADSCLEIADQCLSSSAIRCSSWTHLGQTGVGDGDPSLMPRQNTNYQYSGKSNRAAAKRGCH